MINASWKSSEHWNEGRDTDKALIYYSIQVGQQAAFLIESAIEGSISPVALKGFEEASKKFDWWFERYCESEHEPDHVGQAGAILLHHALGLNNEMKDSLDSISQQSLSVSELNELLETLQWWDTGFRRFLRHLSTINYSERELTNNIGVGGKIDAR